MEINEMFQDSTQKYNKKENALWRNLMIIMITIYSSNPRFCNIIFSPDQWFSLALCNQIFHGLFYLFNFNVPIKLVPFIR